MVRPRTAPDPSQMTACVLDRRLRSQPRRLRVSANGLHRPSTAPPGRRGSNSSSNSRSPAPAAAEPAAAEAESDGQGSRRGSAASAGSAGSALAEMMVIEEDGHGVISNITSPPSVQGSGSAGSAGGGGAGGGSHNHSSAWLDGNELAAINGGGGKLDDNLQRMKDTLTAQLAATNGAGGEGEEESFSLEQRAAMQSALAGLIALEQQLQQHGGHSAAATMPEGGGPAPVPAPDRYATASTNAGGGDDVDAERRHTSRLLEVSTTVASEGKAVRSHVLRDCDERIAALEEERNDLKRRLKLLKRDSRQGRLESDQLDRMLALKEQEAAQLQGHKLALESQVYTQGVVTTDQQEEIEAIKKRMSLEMAHAALMFEETEAQAHRMAGDLTETKQHLGQARQQLAVAKGFAKQLEDRTQAVTYKLRRAEQRRLEAEQALVHSQRALQQQASSSSRPAAAAASARPSAPSADVMAEMAQRRLEHQLQEAQHAIAMQQLEMDELKELKKQWQIETQHEYAPDGTRLGQDVPDFEDTADHGHGVYESDGDGDGDGEYLLPVAPQQPQPPVQPDAVRVPIRPSSAHPRLQAQAGGGGSSSSRGGRLESSAALAAAPEDEAAGDGTGGGVLLTEE
jgi:hypothetical protein